ncbi:hypothetical protein LTS18_007290 [Coniosporium uncinatum]|uniref:Uncharacterized protein n=1 Tax=Coniosporium uncinatum TaxID=93489 RepID=A0ACC3DPF0_9PEZI|nr:hypothetical protein LTS18_007290 [Coniosporium uncinatum]
MNLDFGSIDPKSFMEMFPVTIPLAAIDHKVLVHDQVISIPAPSDTIEYSRERPSYEASNPLPLNQFAPTGRAPLGSIVHARSGNKANNSNVGFFVRHTDEYPWLQSFLTVQRLREMFQNDWSSDYKVERCEFPNILAVHFLILDFLDGGIASSSRVDGLGKDIGEYLRSKEVDIPVKSLSRGRI